MKKISIFLKLLLSLSLIGCLIYYELIDLNLLKDFSFDDYILIILINFFIFFLATLRWHLILKSYAIYNNFLDILKLNLISIFFGNFFVGQYGGDFVRGYYIYKKKKENRINAVLSIIFDRFFGLLGLISIVLILSLVNKFNLFFEILIFFITIGLILIAFFFRYSKK